MITVVINESYYISVVTVTFVSSTYIYNEDHGEVSDIKVQLSNSIAQSLVVSYSGGKKIM